MLVAQAARAAEVFSGQRVTAQAEASVLFALRRQTENLILVGMPGAGKTTIGQLVAERLGRQFVDADQLLEKATGGTIPELFERVGEGGFRDWETELLTQLGRKSGKVIATGGGCVTRLENYPHLHQNGVIICLERALSDLPREGRPLSEQLDLKTMYAKRRPHYQHFADRTVENAGSPTRAADRVVEVFYEVLGD